MLISPVFLFLLTHHCPTQQDPGETERLQIRKSTGGRRGSGRLTGQKAEPVCVVKLTLLGSGQESIYTWSKHGRLDDGLGEKKCTRCTIVKTELSTQNTNSNTLALYAYLHVLFTHSDSLTTLWRVSLKAVAVIGPW